MIVDCQSHLFPPDYGRFITRNRGDLKVVETPGAFLASYGDTQKFTLPRAKYTPENSIRAMDSAGVDVSICSANIPGPELLDEEIRAEGARVCNDGMASECSRYPGRLAGLASLPFTGNEEDTIELGRAVTDLGLKGFILPSNVRGLPVDSPQFLPMYKKARDLGVPAVIHPTVPSWSAVIQDYSMIPMVGMMMDTSIAALRLILSGIMEEVPDLKVVHPHCGGVIPYLMPRIHEQTEVKGRGRENITKPPEEYYKSFYLDMVSPSEMAMRWVMEFHSAERLLFATDHPWVSTDDMLAMFKNLDLPESARSQILGENAVGLFGLGG